MMRSLVLVFLCFCLAVSGTAAALPMVGMAMAATPHMTSMPPDCPDMAGTMTMPAADDTGATLDERNADCCRAGRCACVAAHGVYLLFTSTSLPRIALPATTIIVIGESGYASPALVRLIRPPIS